MIASVAAVWTSDSVNLEGTAHFVESVAMIARDFAGLRYVAELSSELQQ